MPCRAAAVSLPSPHLLAEVALVADFVHLVNLRLQPVDVLLFVLEGSVRTVSWIVRFPFALLVLPSFAARVHLMRNPRRAAG